MTCMRARTSLNFEMLGPLTAELAVLERLEKSPQAYNGKNDFFSDVRDQILFILAGNDYIHESLDEFEIRLDPTTGFHGNIYGYDWEKRCLHFFSAVFHLFLFKLAGNDDMDESSDEFEFRPDWTTDCGVSCP